MDSIPFEFKECRPGHTNPDPVRHEAIIFEEKETGLIHELHHLANDGDDPEKINFRMKLSDKAGGLYDDIEGWIERKRIMESAEVIVWVKEHNKQIAGAGVATAMVVAVGSLVVRYRKHH